MDELIYHMLKQSHSNLELACYQANVNFRLYHDIVRNTEWRPQRFKPLLEMCSWHFVYFLGDQEMPLTEIVDKAIGAFYKRGDQLNAFEPAAAHRVQRMVRGKSNNNNAHLLTVAKMLDRYELPNLHVQIQFRVPEIYPTKRIHVSANKRIIDAV